MPKIISERCELVKLRHINCRYHTIFRTDKGSDIMPLNSLGGILQWGAGRDLLHLAFAFENRL